MIFQVTQGKGLIDLLNNYKLTKQIGSIPRRCTKPYQLHDFVPSKCTIRRSRLSMMHGTGNALTKTGKKILSPFQACLTIFEMDKYNNQKSFIAASALSEIRV